MQTFGIIALSALCILLILAIVIIIVKGMNMLAEEFKQPTLTIDGRERVGEAGSMETVDTEKPVEDMKNWGHYES